jgi:peroxiredoxin
MQVKNEFTWILFDEADHRRPAPYFRLPSALGRPVALDDYRGRDNLVVFFAHSTGCPDCAAALGSFASRMPAYNRQEGVILAIFPDPVEEIRVSGLSDLPFPLLADTGGEVRRIYAALMAESLVDDGDVLLFVLDRYGAPYAALVGSESGIGAEGFHHETLKWLEYIELQCPE